MRRLTISTLTLAFCLTGGAAALSDEAETATVVYFGFTRLDPDTERAIPDSFVVVRDGHIDQVGQGAPPDLPHAVRHDMSGLYGLPGFVDAHAHITAGPHAVEIVDGAPLVTIESRPDITAFHARMALAFGVTTVRNPGGDPAANAAYDRNVAEGIWIGPDALHAGAVIQPPPFGGSAFVYPATPEEWDAEAARQAAMGMTYFKLYHGLTEDELAQGIEAAHRNGLQAIAHLDQVSWATAVDLGIDGLLHALPTSPDLLEPAAREAYLAERGAGAQFMYQWFEYADLDGPLMRGLITELAERQIEVDLTLLVNELIYERDAMDRLLPDDERQFYHPETLAAALEFSELARHDWTDEDYARAEQAMTAVHDFVRRLHAAGVPLLIGTDGNGGTPGYSEELRLHVEAGLPEWTVLRLATSGSAEGLGLGSVTGRLAKGYEADIVFLSGNPLDDITHTKSIRHVVTNGHGYSFETLTAATAATPDQH